jgi:myo-inositol-1(or 4)-monophosphatase
VTTAFPRGTRRRGRLRQDRRVTSPPGAGAPPDPAELRELAVDVAREAAALVAAGRASAADDVDVKSSPVDVVTAVDKASEALIVSRLMAARPDDGLLGEEGASRAGTSGVRWVVDPIDGTTNFLYGVPAYAVSIAAEVDGVVRAGAVLNVATGELFTATSGGGAYLSSPALARPVRLRGSAPASLAQALVATGFSYGAEQRRAQGAVVARLLPQVRDIRRFGSSALDLCGAAAGRVDAYYELELNPWDFAAGALVAVEAGVTVTGLPGRPFADPMAIAVAATIADEFVDLLASLYPG